jgi:folate-binding protein YgfZ
MDSKTQVDAARSSVLAVPRSDLTTVEVSGEDRLSWLNGLLTCDLVKRAPGRAPYGLVVARSGRVLSDAVVVVEGPPADDERVVLVVPLVAVGDLLKHLQHYLVMEDATLTPEPEAYVAWTLHGPRSADALAAAMKAGRARGGIFDATGLGGALVLVPAAAGDGARAALEASVAAAGGVVGDDEGWEALRLERAVPRFRHDFDEKTYPQEAGLERTAVSFDKGCYLGQEVVCMLEMRGHVKRKLAALVVDGALPERGAAVVDAAGAPAGEVTSSVLSPTLGKPVALAMVKRAYAEPGTHLVVSGTNAVVVDRPV